MQEQPKWVEIHWKVLHIMGGWQVFLLAFLCPLWPLAPTVVDLL